MLRVENGVVFYTPFGEEEIEVGNLADGEVEEGYLSIGSYSFPLEKFHEIQTAWGELYPNGKPKPEIEPLELMPTEQEVQKAQNEIDTINLLIDLGVLPNVE